MSDEVHPNEFLSASARSITYKRSFNGSIVTAASQGGRILVQLTSQLILARILLPKDFGLVAMILPLLSFAQIFVDYGFAQTLIQKSQISNRLINSVFWSGNAICFTVALTLFIMSSKISGLYNEPQLSMLIKAGSIQIVAGGLTIIPIAILNRNLRFIIIAKIEIASIIIGSIVSIFVALQYKEASAILLQSIVAASCASILYWREVNWRPTWFPKFTGMTSIISSSSAITLAGIANFLGASGATILIGATQGAVALGLYDRSYRLVVVPIIQAAIPVNRIALPLLSKLIALPEEYERAFLIMVQLTSILTVPFIMTCVLCSREVVEFALGAQWLAASTLFFWICIGGLATSFYTSSSWLFISQGRTWLYFLATIIGSVINLTSFAIGSSWGIVGAASTAALTFVLIQTPLSYALALSSGPVRIRPFIKCCLRLIFVYGSAFLITSFIVYMSNAIAVSRITLSLFSTYLSSIGIICAFPASRLLIRQAWALYSGNQLSTKMLKFGRER